MANEWIQGGVMLVRLGLAVWEAVERGEHTKTVRQIFDGVPRDAETIERLRESARQHYEARVSSASPTATIPPVVMPPGARK